LERCCRENWNQEKQSGIVSERAKRIVEGSVGDLQEKKLRSMRAWLAALKKFLAPQARIDPRHSHSREIHEQPQGLRFFPRPLRRCC